MTSEPILGCSCGKDHPTMPMIDVGEYPDTFMVEGVCRVHKRHVPCRPCSRDRAASIRERFAEARAEVRFCARFRMFARRSGERVCPGDHTELVGRCAGCGAQV